MLSVFLIIPVTSKITLELDLAFNTLFGKLL